MISTLISIGHGAYAGDNAQALFRSRIGAIMELVERGIPYGKARQSVDEVLAHPESHLTVSHEHIGPIEVCNVFTRAQAENWPCLGYTLFEWRRAKQISDKKRGPARVPNPYSVIPVHDQIPT